MEKYLSHIGAPQSAKIYWLVFDTSQNTNLIDQAFVPSLPDNKEE